MEAFCLALATAEPNTFRTAKAAYFLVNISIFRASPIFFPRIKSTTNLTFWGETRIYLAVALASISSPNNHHRQIKHLPRQNEGNNALKAASRSGFASIICELLFSYRPR